ncbi:S8 family serine peptidase [Actinoplanes sp. LDG1-06]|uniref:S8 family serine peptidase n=1 Tax=Paractinoplanes ovalisporus TaxID=2810368 RepID=A0ABS2AQK4_9ACTN|nr:S8 family serine peptidase [Actinoplanes ovalisporus]MBM2622147.1 S8 family serine peptidase [Actinoplanes ovalisporus]
MTAKSHRIVSGAVALAIAAVAPAAPARADSFRNDQWYLKTLQISKAHAISTGNGITVAVVDSGSAPHPDIRNNLLAGANLIPGSKGDGRIDSAGHGTNMAAIIAAHGRNNNDGVLGIAPRAEILPVKITNSGNQISAETMGRGVKWAADQGAEVINVSAQTGPGFELINSVKSAIQNNIVVVAGVGNKSSQAIIAYPAAIDGVLVVGAIDRNGKRASFSVTDRKIQLCAPGVDITTAEPQRKYVDVDGTSAATAVVSGAVALVRAKFPDLSQAEVIHRLTATADDIGPPGRDDECGFGRLNIVRALTADVAPLGSGTSAPASGGVASGSSTSAPGAIRPEFASPAPTGNAAEAESAGNGSVLLFGGLAGVVAAGALVLALVLRRRGRGRV